MSLIDHLALAVDFAAPSQVAARGALKLAELTQAKRLNVLHAVNALVLPHGDQPVVKQRLERLHKKIRVAAEQGCDKLIKGLTVPKGLQVDVKIVEGRPAVAIPKAAQEIGAGLLMVGTASRKGLQRFFKGSIAETMVRKTEIPTLVMLTGGDGVEPEQELMELRTMLIALDLDQGADHVTEVGVKLATAFQHVDPEVTLLSVTELPEAPEDQMGEEEANEYRAALRDVATAQLERLVKTYGNEHVTMATRICDGEARDKILQVAEELKVGIIVVGTHGQGGAPLIDVGSNTERVVRNAQVAVLVVPSHPEQL